MGRIERQGMGARCVHLRRSRGVRRMSLRVSSIDGRVTLTVPQNAPLGAARAFLAEQDGWIENVLSGVAAPLHVGLGIDLPVEGRPVRVAAGDLRAPKLDGSSLLVGPERPGPRIEAFLKSLARDRLTAAVDEFAGAIDASPGRITLRDTRSRWGSCSARGDLMFSWRLVMAPPDVLRYVAAHEVAHLRHLDHSPAFWDLTKRLFPAEAAARRWLREEGTGLHRFRFREEDG